MVDVIVANNTNFPNNIEVNGTVLSEEMIELHPEVSGRLIYLNIPDGSEVKEGTILARINDADLEALLNQQQAQLSLAEKTEQRLKKLLAINGVNQADYDAALNQVESLKASVDITKAQIDKTIIKAPFTGKLGIRIVSPGAYVTPQTLIGTLQQADKIKIDFIIPDAYANIASIGSKVLIQTNSSDEKLNATISAIEPQINVSTRNIKIRARLDEGKINPGAFVKVLLSENRNGILVPSSSVIPDALSNQLVIVKNGKALFVKVETGIRNSDLVEINKGIKSGDSVVVSGVLFLRPNAKVKIKKIRDKK